MKTVALIACSGSKLAHRAPACELYTGALFRKSLAFARATCDDIRIVSALHHVVLPEQELDPYDYTLQHLCKKNRFKWGGHVVSQLDRQFTLADCQFVILAGALYREPIVVSAFLALKKLSYTAPLQGLGIGDSMHWLDTNIPQVIA